METGSQTDLTGTQIDVMIRRENEASAAARSSLQRSTFNLQQAPNPVSSQNPPLQVIKQPQPATSLNPSAASFQPQNEIILPSFWPPVNVQYRDSRLM